MVVIMGVAGAGKSTVGAALADALGCRFVDGDELHPAANVDKMRRGQPLDDADRAPWLDAIAARIADALARGQDLVVACSALKEAYRARLRLSPAVKLALLTAPPALLAARVARRVGHYLPPSLLPSQLAALEPARGGDLVVGSDRPVAEVVDELRRALGR